jgi:hypothetical protein
MAECARVDGIVCRRNVAHKKMRSRIDNPRILILEAGLEYERRSNKLSSLDAVYDQVCSYLLLRMLSCARARACRAALVMRALPPCC